MKLVDVSGNLTFGDIEMNVWPRAKLLDYVQERYHILYGVCHEFDVVSVTFTSQFEATRGNFVALVRGRKPSDK